MTDGIAAGIARQGPIATMSLVGSGVTVDNRIGNMTADQLRDLIDDRVAALELELHRTGPGVAAAFTRASPIATAGTHATQGETK